ncbi:MAG: LysM peptidoglycan-binding domain-containing protein, partial [Proteobacteria bacterium]
MSTPDCPGLRRIRDLGASLALALVVGACLVADSRAAVDVPRYELDCNADFPCHDALRRRTDFWIHVYNTWTTAQGVFHDSLHPERVYSVIEVPNGCRGSSKTVERERGRVEARLGQLARKVQDGSNIRDADDKALLSLFSDRSPKAIRAAARQIRCQQGNRDRFEAALQRYGAYGPVVRKLIVDSGLSEDIHYLPFVESLYNPAAYSRVGAAGLWQIMPKTARYLGLELDATVDERLDVEAATLGAVRYLKDSRNRLTAVAREKRTSVRPGDLTPFIITSYNYGVNGMRRALNQFGPDFVKVINEYKSPSFQVAVKNFYASFLAARHVARNADRYFGRISPDPALRYHTAVLDHDTSMKRILDVFGLSEDELKPLNRALTRFVWHGWRFAPKGYRLRLPYRADGWGPQIARLESLGPEDESRGPVRYSVRRGDTACGIARAFHVKCKDLIDMNRLGSRAFIRVGQSLVIPGKLGTGGGSAVSAGPGGTYRVKAGDSLCGIAGRAGVGCDALLAANGLSRRSVIHPGQSLVLPGDESGAAISRDREVGVEKPDRPSRYTVRRGDTACEIAQRLDVACRDLMR